MHFELAREVAFTFGDFLQAVGHTANRTYDHTGETGTDDCEHHGQYGGDRSDQPRQAGGAGHHFVTLDQADKAPAQVFGTDHVSHVGHAIDAHLGHAIAVLGQFGVVRAQARQGLEVVRGIAGVHQHVAVGFHQHQVAAVAQLDGAHQLGELLERHVKANHPKDVTRGIRDGAHGADQHHIVRGPVVGACAHGLAWRCNGGLVPGAGARVVLRQLGVVRPTGVAAIAQSQGQVGGTGVAFGELIKNRQQFGVGRRQRNLRCIGAGVVLQVLGRDHTRVFGDEVDILADAVEKLLHAIVDLADLAAAAVEEVGQRTLAQIQHHDNGDQDDRHARDGRKRPCQLLLDIHDFTRGYL